MSIEDKIYIGDIGTKILVDSGSDLTDSTKVSLKVKKPGIDEEAEWEGTTLTETLQEYVDDTTAKLTDDDFEGMDPGDNVTRRIQYLTVDGDLDVSKTYKVQAYSESPTWQGRGKTFEILVYAHFK